MQTFSLLSIKRAFLLNTLKSHAHAQFSDISTETSLTTSPSQSRTHGHHVPARSVSTVTELFNRFECN